MDWISVDQRLPQPLEEVLCCWSADSVFERVIYDVLYVDERGEWMDEDNDEIVAPTHWMKLTPPGA